MRTRTRMTTAATAAASNYYKNSKLSLLEISKDHCTDQMQPVNETTAGFKIVSHIISSKLTVLHDLLI